MPVKCVVDTHALLWFLGEDSRLSLAARSALSKPDNSLIIPAIVLAETCRIVKKGCALITVETMLAAIDNDPNSEVYPLTRSVASYLQQ